ncbi:MAG: POTRA domain-containing protein, partial [Ignavibacteriaceae bacterium]
MFRRAKNLTLIILFPIVFINSQTIRNIEISGNSTASNSEILNWIGLSPGQKIYNGIIDSVKSRLALNYANIGYFHCTFGKTEIISLPDSQEVDLSVSIDENDPTYLNNIRFINASSSDSINIIPIFSYLEGKVFDSTSLEESISSALTYYENNGNPFSKITISSINFLNDSTQEKYFVNLNLIIDIGKVSTIDKIEIGGNTKTKDYVITREMRLSTGEKFSENLIKEIPYRLNRLGFFEPVGVPDYYINAQNEGVLVVKVKDKQTNNFDGIIGYVPGDVNTSGYVTGLVNISLRNIFGTGRAAAIRWQKLDKSSQELELKYLEPWVFNLPFNINAGLYQRKQDSTYIQRRLNFALEFLANENFSAALTLSTESVIPSDTDTLTLTVYNSNSITTGLNLKLDTRDDPYSPTQGLLFINSYSFSRKTINGPEKFITPDLATKVDLQRIELEFKIFYQPFQRQVIALGLNGKELRGSFFEVSDLYRLGGANTLRGYIEDQFLGSRIFWSNLEYRFLLTQRSFTFLFLDTGYFYRPEDLTRNILKTEGVRIGYGLGINLE